MHSILKYILKNYRPITNLPFLAKTLERLAATQLNQHLSTNGLYSEMQSTYRANYSTETALVRVCNDINMALDIHKEVILVLLDLSSAFDMIDHEILITRLADSFGIRGTVLRWIKSYLYNRTQSIVIGDVQSVISPIDCGVPQDLCCFRFTSLQLKASYNHMDCTLCSMRTILRCI